MVRKSGPQSPLERSKALTPQDRLAILLQDAEARGIRPVDEAALEAMGEGWPEDDNLEEFLTWLRKSRRSGRYG